MNSNSPTVDAAPDRTQSLTARDLMASLTTKDVQTSLAWYVDVLGFTVDERYEPEGTLRAASLKAGNVKILLSQDNGAKGWDRVKGQGISLQITTEQDIDAIAARIKAAGGTLESEPADTPWGSRVFRLQDPDGFKLVIASPRTA